MSMIALFLVANSQMLVSSQSFSQIERVGVGSPSAVIWEDDFDDMLLEGWTTSALNLSDGGTPCDADFSLDEGFLLANNSDLLNMASHSSATSYGTWDFDVRVENTSVKVLSEVYFVTTGWSDQGPTGYCLGIQNNNSYGELDGPGFGIERTVNDLAGNFAELVGGSSIESGIVGWHHITITRTPANRFRVYLNRSLIIDVVDTETQSVTLEGDLFLLIAQEGIALDNIRVSDSIDYETDAPAWLEPPTDQIVVEGLPFRYDLNASDPAGLDTWWLNETDLFVIGAEGIITNSSSIPVGTYRLGVHVNDSYGNVLYGEFQLRVVPRFPDLSLLVLLVGSVSIALIAGVVLFRRRGR